MLLPIPASTSQGIPGHGTHRPWKANLRMYSLNLYGISSGTQVSRRSTNMGRTKDHRISLVEDSTCTDSYIVSYSIRGNKVAGGVHAQSTRKYIGAISRMISSQEPTLPTSRRLAGHQRCAALHSDEVPYHNLTQTDVAKNRGLCINKHNIHKQDKTLTQSKP